jgi:heptosyltransferase-2
MENILVIQTAFIGDAILTLPMIEKLKEKFPHSSIDVLCIPSTKEIFSASPSVNNVLVMDKKGEHKSFINLYKFTNEIKSRKYSKIYSPHRSLRTAFIVMRSRVKETYGFSNSAMFHVYKNIIDYNYESHEVKRNLDLIGYEYSDESWRIVPALNINGESRNKVKQFLALSKLGDKIIAIGPGSVWETKKYPENYFKEVISYFVNKSISVLLIGSNADKQICERLVSGNTDLVVSSAGLFNVIETIELLKKVQVLITNDSAPTHIGMCADIPVLTIYTSTVPAFGFYPYNKKSLYISYNDLKCKPCGIHGYEKCPIKSFDCGYKLKPQMLIGRIEKMLYDQD